MQQRNFFPRYIDKPRLVGIVEIDEFFLFFGIAFASMVTALALPEGHTGSFILGSMFLGISAAYGLRKLKNNRADGYAIHLFYKKGIIHPSDNKTDELSHSYLKRMRTVPYGFTKELKN